MNSKVYYIIVYDSGRVKDSRNGNAPMLYTSEGRARAAATGKYGYKPGFRVVPVVMNEVTF